MAAPAVVEPSDLNLPPPTAAESANNPTRTIQYEYTHFLRDIEITLQIQDAIR